MAAVGFSNVGLGCVHSMTHPLGARFDVPHGVANALLLLIVMEFNLSAAKDKYGDIARAMGVDTTGMSIDEAVRKFSLDLGISQTLRELKIPENALPQLANDAINDVCNGGNPRAIPEEDILELYKKAY